jgi:hypothetical protein
MNLISWFISISKRKYEMLPLRWIAKTIRGFILILPFILTSCRDIGIQAPYKPLISASNIVVVMKDSTVHIILSGGTLPYTIKTQPDSLVASASLLSSDLNISGVDTGRTYVIIIDSKTPEPDSVKIGIIVVTQLPTQHISYSSEIQPIFNNRCIQCHPGNGGLNLISGVSYNQLVNVTAISSCTNLLRVVPDDANNSVLYKKVAGTACGMQMPQGGNLTVSDINKIRDWINQGANNN